ncbi:hypothetical protein ANMWB30_24580 [Arthrobacter sp. MWB30]|nr:hypothetical protein ANMWB30_24580 [Arthrobacter sp. MWB30]
MVTATKAVTKSALSTFVRDNTGLNLTQSKALSDQLLAEYSITPKPPADPNSLSIDIGQEWLHTGSQRIVRVTNIEQGPQRIPEDPVTVWGPERISFEYTQRPGFSGAMSIASWRKYMIPVEHGSTSPDPESDH